MREMKGLFGLSFVAVVVAQHLHLLNHHSRLSFKNMPIRLLMSSGLSKMAMCEPFLIVTR